MNQNKNHSDLSTYLKESKHFLELFSTMEKGQKKLLDIKKKDSKSTINKTNNYVVPEKKKSKTLIRKKPNGYINIIITTIITIILGTITILSILLSYFILKIG